MGAGFSRRVGMGRDEHLSIDEGSKLHTGVRRERDSCVIAHLGGDKEQTKYVRMERMKIRV